jgi:hypothetical protein
MTQTRKMDLDTDQLSNKTPKQMRAQKENDKSVDNILIS